MAEINTEEWLAEFEKVMEGEIRHQPTVEGRGFTLNDLMAHAGLSRTRAHDVVKAKVKAGTFKHIGYRPTKNGPKVYEMVEDGSV